MKRILSLLALSLFFSANSYAQPKLLWEKSFGGSFSDGAASIVKTEDGGFAVTGNTNSHDGDISGVHGVNPTDIFVAKFTSTGIMQWIKTFGGYQTEEARKIIQTADGGYFIAGNSSSDNGDVAGNKGGNDCWIVKLNASGTIEWQKNYGGRGSDYSLDAGQDAEGNYFFLASINSKSGDISTLRGLTDYWLVKLNPSGDILWEKTIGGSSYDGPVGLAVTKDKGCVVVGSTLSKDGDIPGNKGASDVLIVKVDTHGKLVWAKTYGGTYQEYANSVIECRDGGYLVACNTLSNDHDAGQDTVYGSNDGWLLRLDESGNIIWNKRVGGNGIDNVTEIIQLANGDFLGVGSTESRNVPDFNPRGMKDLWVICVAPDGTKKWRRNYGGSNDDVAGGVAEISPGTYIVAGSSRSSNKDVSVNKGSTDCWLLALGDDETLPVTLSNLTAFRLGSYIQIGWQTFSETNNKGFFVQRSTGNPDGFGNIAFVNSKGVHGTSAGPLTYQYADFTKEFEKDYFYRLAQVDLDGSIRYSNVVKINALAGIHVSLLPNPASGSVLVSGLDANEETSIFIYDAAGHLLANKKIKAANCTLNISHYQPGSYFIKVQGKQVKNTYPLNIVR